MLRDEDDHDTPGGPWAVLRGTYEEIQAELLRVASVEPGPHTHHELRVAAIELDRGEREVRIGHCRMIRTDL